MHKNLTYKINGCLFQVYNKLKNVWEEEVYEEALHQELQSQGLQAERQKNLAKVYKPNVKKISKFFILTSRWDFIRLIFWLRILSLLN